MAGNTALVSEMVSSHSNPTSRVDRNCPSGTVSQRVQQRKSVIANCGIQRGIAPAVVIFAVLFSDKLPDDLRGYSRSVDATFDDCRYEIVSRIIAMIPAMLFGNNR